MTEPAPLPIATPPGWYPEPLTGRQRWWDGIQWAFYLPPNATTSGPPSGSSTPTDPYAGAVYPAAYRHPTNGIATASLVLSLLVCFYPLSILAVIFGLVGLSRAKERGGVGRGNAIAGLIIGGIVLALWITIATVTA